MGHEQLKEAEFVRSQLTSQATSEILSFFISSENTMCAKYIIAFPYIEQFIMFIKK